MEFSLTILLLAGLTVAVPVVNKSIQTKKFHRDSLVIYKSNHDIVSICVPTNALNFVADGSTNDSDIKFFFVEADTDLNDKRTYHGIYVYKSGNVTKLLDNGKDVDASSDRSTKVFFGAEDGIYEYKEDTNTAVKYGSVTDNIIGIAKTNSSDIIYILTEDLELYNVTDAGHTKIKVNEVSNAQEIVLDYMNNIYFYDKDKKSYVLTVNGLNQIEGLPNKPKKINLFKAPFSLQYGVIFVVDNVSYRVLANGTSVLLQKFDPENKPTAAALETGLIIYYGYNKKIYKYNLVDLIIEAVFQQIGDYFNAKLLGDNNN